MAKLTSLQSINSNEVNLQDGLYLAHKINDNPDTYEDRRININKLAGALPTEDIKYDNSESGLTASDVQGAIDELAAGGREVLNDLTDVSISSPAANQLLQYNSTTEKWENKQYIEGANHTIDSTVLLANIHAEGYSNTITANGAVSHVEGQGNTVSAQRAHAEGNGCTASATNAHAEGSSTSASAANAHSEGTSTTASGASSHAEGTYTQASNTNAHAEGTGSVASGMQAHAEGSGSQATGTNSHSEGAGCRATGDGTHAEGAGSLASGTQSHAEGGGCTATAAQAHAEGGGCNATAQNSHAEGCGTIAASENQHAGGRYNIEDNQDVYAEIIGNGTNDTSVTPAVLTRSNARTLDWSGNEMIAGDLTFMGNKSLNTMLPDPPATDGTYTLQCTVLNGVATYAWV